MSKRTTTIYDSAFQAEYYAQYGGIKEIRDALDDLPYKRAISAFIQKGGKDAERDRRELLYQYLKSKGLRHDTEDSKINQQYNTLPNSNYETRRVIDNLCKVYTDEVTREYKNVNKSVTKLINEITDEVSFNSKMQKIHEICKSNASCLVHPRVRNKKLDLQILRPEQYVTIKNDYGKLTDVYIHYTETIHDPSGYETKTEGRIKHWNDEYMTVYNTTGQIIPITRTIQVYNEQTESFQDVTLNEDRYEHGLGMIPFLEVSFTDNDGDGTEDGEDLYELILEQLFINMIDFLLTDNTIYTVMVWVAINLGLEDKAEFGPDRVIAKDDVSAETGLAPPELFNVQANIEFEAFQDLKESRLKDIMKKLGLPTSIVTDNPGLASSGVAMKQDRIELEEIRQKDINKLRQFDKRIIKLLILFAHKDMSSKYKGEFSGIYDNTTNEIELDFSVDYADQGIHETPKEQIERLSFLAENGLISPTAYVKQLTGNSTLANDEQAIEYMINNKNYFKQIFNGDTNGQDGIPAQSGANEPINAKTKEQDAEPQGEQNGRNNQPN